MKKRIPAAALSFLCLVICLAGCSVFDKDYGKSAAETVSQTHKVNISVPEIMSDDENMPTYFDISLYDEENYAEIYLGRNYEYRFTYSGATLNLPASYKSMVKAGWTFLSTPDIKPDSKIMARRSAEVQFKDSFGKQITLVFYNNSNSIKSLITCPIVKFIVGENSIYKKESVYGQFWINGVSNDSAITDVIDCLGAPSHFYAVDKNNYYLDYFLTKKDKRSKIRVYINLANDCVTRVEVSYY